MPGPGYSFFGDEEVANINAVVRRWQQSRDAFGAIAGESQVSLFTKEAAATFGSPYCLATNSGTSALQTALAALEIGPGDEVIVPGYMFVASIGSIVFAGATPVLAEIDESLTLDPADVLAKITPKTRAIMAVHMLGAPCDLTALTAIARQRGLALIEDTAQACGGSYHGQLLGTVGDAGTFSLNAFKVITAGDGGFTLIKDKGAFQRGYSFHFQGWMPDSQGCLPDLDESAPGETLFGLNLRMTEFIAAIARAQLAKLDRILDQTRAVKQELARQIPVRDGLRRRVLHDPAGDCGTLLVYVFDDPEDAARVAGKLGVKVLLDSPKHQYGGIAALPMLAAGGVSSAPHRAQVEASRRDSYVPGALPRTDDVLSRSVAIAVGVSDAYLGAGFGVTAHSTGPAIDQAADQFRSAVDSVLA